MDLKTYVSGFDKAEKIDKGMPDVNNLKVMAQLLNVSVDYLLDEDEKFSLRKGI